MRQQSIHAYPHEVRGSRHLLPAPSLFIFVALLALLSATSVAASAANIYIAQVASGAANGADCADAYASTFFNTPGNWGTGASQIGPGTIVHLCGTITANLTFRGNGSSGSPVVLDGTGATLSAFIDTSTQYWTIQNITWSTSYATNSANQAVIQTSNGAAFGTIQNNHMDIQSSSQCVFFGAITHDITVQNNYLKVSTPPAGDGFDTDVLDTEGAYNVMVQGNYIAMNIGAGDETCSGCHDDLTQVWSKSGLTANSSYNWTYRYNYFVQESSPTKANNQSLMMEEQISLGTAGYWDVYSNVFQCMSSGSSANGIAFDSNGIGMSAHIYDNTIVENSGACNNLLNISGSGSYYLENNIIYNTDAGNALTGGETFANRNNNLWYGPNIPSCTGFSTDICGSDPLFTNYSANDFSLKSSSPAIGAGANLGSAYALYPIPETTWPNPSLGTRPSSLAWDTGASQSSSSRPAPPTAPTATVH